MFFHVSPHDEPITNSIRLPNHIPKKFLQPHSPFSTFQLMSTYNISGSSFNGFLRTILANVVVQLTHFKLNSCTNHEHATCACEIIGHVIGFPNQPFQQSPSL